MKMPCFVLLIAAVLIMGTPSPARSQDRAKALGEWEGVSAKDGTILRITLAEKGRFTVYVVEKDGGGQETPHSVDGTYAIDTSVTPWKLTLTPNGMPVMSTLLSVLSKDQMLIEKFDQPPPVKFTIYSIVLSKAR